MSKILIIEDEDAIADLEKDYLELSDFTVEIAGDGIEGEKKALEEDFDLIVLDLMLPGKELTPISSMMTSFKMPLVRR